jgi:hypothetical protein
VLDLLDTIQHRTVKLKQVTEKTDKEKDTQVNIKMNNTREQSGMEEDSSIVKRKEAKHTA